MTCSPEAGPVSGADESDELGRCRVRLPRPRRVQLTVRLRLYRHLTNAEIGAQLGISEKAVEHNMTRAIRALREGMGVTTEMGPRRPQV